MPEHSTQSEGIENTLHVAGEKQSWESVRTKGNFPGDENRGDFEVSQLDTQIDPFKIEHFEYIVH